MNYKLSVKKISIKNNLFRFVVEGEFEIVNELSRPKVVMHFFNGVEDRRLPIVIKSVKRDEESGIISFRSDYEYMLNHLFWDSKNSGRDFEMFFNVMYGDFYEEKAPVNLEPEEAFEQDSRFVYCSVHKKSLLFTYQSDWNRKKTEGNKREKYKSIKKVINRTYHWLTFPIGLCLLPWFMFDALMATLGIVGYAGKDQKKHKRKLAKFIIHVNARLRYLTQHAISMRDLKKSVRSTINNAKKAYLLRAFNKLKKHKAVVPNRISFISVRRTELSGNFWFVHEQIKNDSSLDIQLYLNTSDIQDISIAELKRFAYLCATSKVVVLDEFTPWIHYFDMRQETKIVQLWHACGAFKTFGFTRLGKPKGSPQKTRNHRSYDYVTVSTKNVRSCHTEGFGIPSTNVVPTGIPRTDVFFDEAYKQATRQRLYAQYPQLAGKKVLLYAPTFRGHVKETAHYPMEMFKVDELLDAIGEDYILIIKHHPFVKKRHPVPLAYQNRVLDLSKESELNDLLFITDLIITDYSSLVFEASLLNIPMLFYTFDIKKYISERDFYFNFESFVPGQFFYTQEELQRAIVDEDFALEKVDAFKRKFFDDLDGCATHRVVQLLYHAMKE